VVGKWWYRGESWYNRTSIRQGLAGIEEVGIQEVNIGLAIVDGRPLGPLGVTPQPFVHVDGGLVGGGGGVMYKNT
jgi:hypothetical protein